MLLSLSVGWGLWSAGCAHDPYEQRVHVIKAYTSAFYDALQDGRVADAILENERIEFLARQGEDHMLRHESRMDRPERIQEWSVIKTAKRTAAENWLALAEYFAKTQQADRARETYQRILETYREPPYRSYAERAERGLRDLDLLLAPGQAD